MSRRKSFTIWGSWSTSNCAKVLRRPSALTVQNTGQKASSSALVGLVRYLQSTRNDLTKGKFDTLSIPYVFKRDHGMVRAIGRLMRSAEIASPFPCGAQKPADDGGSTPYCSPPTPSGPQSTPQSSWQPNTNTSTAQRSWAFRLHVPGPPDEPITLKLAIPEVIHPIQYGSSPQRLLFPRSHIEILTLFNDDMSSIRDDYTAWVTADPTTILARHMTNKGNAAHYRVNGGNRVPPARFPHEPFPHLPPCGLRCPVQQRYLLPGRAGKLRLYPRHQKWAKASCQGRCRSLGFSSCRITCSLQESPSHW